MLMQIGWVFALGSKIPMYLKQNKIDKKDDAKHQQKIFRSYHCHYDLYSDSTWKIVMVSKEKILDIKEIIPRTVHNFSKYSLELIEI